MQLTDELLALLDERAARLHVSRSQLIRDAVERYLAQDRSAAVDRAIIDGYTRIPPRDDRWHDAAFEDSLADEPW